MMIRNKILHLCGSIGILMLLGVSSHSATVLNDRFLDNNLANGTNAGEVDAAWYFCNDHPAGTPYAIITDNTAPLNGSVMRNPAGSANNTSAYAALPGGSVTLASAGDYIRFEFDVREAEASNKLISFGLLNDNGTPITSNQMGVTNNLVSDDSGYVGARYTGSQTATVSRRLSTGSTALGLLTGPYPCETDQKPHHITLTVTRLANGELQIEVAYDGTIANQIVDPKPSTYQFNEVMLQASQMDFRWDNIVVATGNGGNALLEDHFLDSAVTNGNNAAELDTAWYFSNALAGGTAYVISTDNNPPLSGGVLRNPAGMASNTSAYGALPGGSVTLARAGDYVRLDFDGREVPLDNKLIVFGLLNDNGTPMTANEFGVSNSQTADDGGYVFCRWTGLDCGTLSRQISGVCTAMATLSGPFAPATDQAPHHMTLILTRLPGNQMSIQVESDNSTDSIIDLAPPTFTFNEIKLLASQVDFCWDNITVTKGSRLPITQWSEWGPGWGRAGLGVIRYNAEGQMSPQAGDMDISSGTMGRGLIEWRDITVDPDGTVNFQDDSIFRRINDSYYGDTSYPWAGMAEYLHTYLKASDTATTSATLRITSFPMSPLVWFNGASISPGQAITLQPGWNRLLIKSLSPSSVSGFSWDNGWWMQVSLENVAGDIQFRTTDPNRKVLVTDTSTAFRYLSMLTRAEDGDQPIFTLGSATTMTVSMSYTLQVGIGTDPDTQLCLEDRTKPYRGAPWVYSIDPALVTGSNSNWSVVQSSHWQSAVPAKVHLSVVNDLGQTISDSTNSLTFGAIANGVVTATMPLTFTSLPLGNYIVFSDLLDPDGNVLVHDGDHSFSVITGPITTAQDQQPRLLGVQGHWLATSLGREQPRMRWLQRVGFTYQQKLVGNWPGWGFTHDGQGTVNFTPSSTISTTLTDATNAGVAVIGDALEGFYHPATDNLVLQNCRPLPPYGTAEWNNTFHNYGIQLATQYKDRIKTWGGSNEIDSALPTTRSAQIYTQAMKQIVLGIKETDPTATYISSSLMGTVTTPYLLNQEWLNTADMVDVHEHPFRAPIPTASSLGGTSNAGRALIVNSGFNKPVIYGETSSPRAHNPLGARGHAGDMVKELAWAINWSTSSTAPIKAIRFLVPYGGPDYEGGGLSFNNVYGDPLPIVNAANVASRLLDGRTKLAAIGSLPADVCHIRVSSPDGAYPETVVIWNNNGPATITVNVLGGSIQVIDVMGRVQTYPVANGKYTLTIGPVPQYLRGQF